MSETASRTSTYAGVGTAELQGGISPQTGEERSEPFTIHGVALGVNDVTVGQSGIKKVWPADELREAAETLTGQPLVRDHRNTTEGKVGTVTHAEFVDELGIIYEAEIAPHYDQLANDIRAGLMEVSVRAYHDPVEDLEETSSGARRVENVYFDNLSVVNDGASPSNSARIGPAENHPAITEASAVVSQGVTYDGQAVATLERDVDTDEFSLSSDDAPDSDLPYKGLREDWDEAEQDDPCWDGYVKVGMKEQDGQKVPRCVPEEEAAQMDIGEDETYEITELSDVEGTYEASDGTMYAIAPDEHDDEHTEHTDDAKYPLTSCTGEDSVEAAWRMRGLGDYSIDQETLARRIQDAAEAMDCDADIVGEESLAPQKPDITEGDWVKWRVDDSLNGQVVHVDDEKHQYMVEVYKDNGHDSDSTGFTLTAGYSDVVPYSYGEDSTEHDDSDELGRSNHQNYEVDEEEWVQWYPSEATEAHGWVLNVDGDSVEIEKWDQNSDGEWKKEGSTVTKDMEAVEPWGNFPRKQEEFADAIDDGDPRKKPAQGAERQEGSDENPDDSAASEENAAGMSTASLDEQEEADIEFSDSIIEGLKNKVEEHNDEHGDEEGKKVTLSMLKKVYRRGAGAYSDSHREGMSRQQWSYARVNAFLYLVRNGTPENDNYTQDNDLLPDGHPRASDSEENAQSQPGTSIESETTDALAQWVAPTVQLAQLSASMDELDEVYSEWEEAVNMTASELDEWADHPCAPKASVDPEAVLERNKRLLETDKAEWDTDDIADAKRTVSFIERMSDSANKPDEPRDGPSGCPSKWAISLLNWAYNPFDEIPAVPDELKDEMAGTTARGGPAELADLSPDHDDVFTDEEDAVSRAMELDLGGETHEHELDGETYYMPGSSHDEYMDAVEESSEHDDEDDMDDEDDDSEEMENGDMDDEDDDESGEEESDEMSSVPVPVASLATSSPSHDTGESITQPMIDYEPATADNITEELSEPVVVEQSDLEELSEKAENAEDVEAELSTLSERLEERDEAAEVVDELSEDDVDLIQSDTDATVVEASAAEMFDEVQSIYAEELAEYAPFTAEELADRFSPTELKERVDDHEEAELSSSIEDAEVDPDGETASAEELAEDGDDAEQDLREKMAAELEDKGWDAQAEKVRAGEIDPVRQE